MFSQLEAAQYNHVLWMGGSPCSGKSSMSDILAAQYGVAVYHVDEAFLKYQDLFTPEQYPMNYKWTHTSWGELWDQSQEVLLKEAVLCYTEHLQFIFADLLDHKDLVIAEGTSLLPEYIKPLISEKSQAIWIVPAESFQRVMYPQRGPFVNYILQQCTNPEASLQNWMDRDVAFARWIREQAQTMGLTCMTVDGERSIEQNAELVASHFALHQRGSTSTSDR